MGLVVLFVISTRGWLLTCDSTFQKKQASVFQPLVGIRYRSEFVSTTRKNDAKRRRSLKVVFVNVHNHALVTICYVPMNHFKNLLKLILSVLKFLCVPSACTKINLRSNMSVDIWT